MRSALLQVVLYACRTLVRRHERELALYGACILQPSLVRSRSMSGSWSAGAVSVHIPSVRPSAGRSAGFSLAESLLSIMSERASGRTMSDVIFIVESIDRVTRSHVSVA